MGKTRGNQRLPTPNGGLAVQASALRGTGRPGICASRHEYWTVFIWTAVFGLVRSLVFQAFQAWISFIFWVVALAEISATMLGAAWDWRGALSAAILSLT
jgi:hypothetical protein